MCHVVESTDNEATRIDKQQHRYTNLDTLDYLYIYRSDNSWLEIILQRPKCTRKCIISCEYTQNTRFKFHRVITLNSHSISCCDSAIRKLFRSVMSLKIH